MGRGWVGGGGADAVHPPAESLRTRARRSKPRVPHRSSSGTLYCCLLRARLAVRGGGTPWPLIGSETTDGFPNRRGAHLQPGNGPSFLTFTVSDARSQGFRSTTRSRTRTWARLLAECCSRAAASASSAARAWCVHVGTHLTIVGRPNMRVIRRGRGAQLRRDAERGALVPDPIAVRRSIFNVPRKRLAREVRVPPDLCSRGASRAHPGRDRRRGRPNRRRRCNGRWSELSWPRRAADGCKTHPARSSLAR